MVDVPDDMSNKELLDEAKKIFPDGEYVDIMLQALKDINKKFTDKGDEVSMEQLQSFFNTAWEEFGQGDQDERGHPKDNA